MKVLRKKYLNPYCVQKNTEPGSIKKYIISITDFLIFLIILEVPIGKLKDKLVRWKLELENWNGCYIKRDNKKKLLNGNKIWKCYSWSTSMKKRIIVNVPKEILKSWRKTWENLWIRTILLLFPTIFFEKSFL